MSVSPPTSSPSTMSGGSRASPVPSSAPSGTTPSLPSSLGAGDSSRAPSLPPTGAQHVVVAGETLEHHIDHRMLDRAVLGVGEQVLLGDISLVGAALGILRQEMIEGLLLRRPAIRRDRLIPLLGIVKHRIDIEDDAAKGIKPVPDNLSDREFGIAADAFRDQKNPRHPLTTREAAFSCIWVGRAILKPPQWGRQRLQSAQLSRPAHYQRGR